METVKYTVLDPRNLADDEVVYELRVRGVFNVQHNQAYRRQNLKKCIDDEIKNQSIMPTQMIFEKSDAVSELQTCRTKVTDLIGSISSEKADVWADRAAHVKNRLKRLAEALPSENAACMRICQDLGKAVIDFEASRKQQQNNADKVMQQNASSVEQPHCSTPISSPTSIAANVSTTTLVTTATTNTTTTTAANRSNSGAEFIQQFGASNFVTADTFTRAIQQMSSQFSSQLQQFTGQMTTQMRQMAQQLGAEQRDNLINRGGQRNEPRNAQNLEASVQIHNASSPHNVTVVPYGQTPVSKWQIKFSGLPKKDDSKSITDVNTFLERVEELMDAHRVLNAEIIEKLNLLLIGPAHSFMAELKRQGIDNWAIIKN